ncbi:uncharacterized protein BDR25DRAFT_304540 [Lindgomyces ingoldianus]|uniref:Uncharacterized protein n=1 Tax=Lindgomyces ingoldianus TaxID=673940 RepID=A0ACB6QR44_9PLEO|nr:uncharacterized protein BDR25DRAFT_304540 [Lindgomyces ingoldianus]KAF2469473.1 hypothetical protein BDR25DRAFT_304540 [Lindgomyces ingoldianus]
MFSMIANTLALASIAAAGTGISITPHDQYSSSVGVLGCKINTNRVAYWPQQPGCNSVCVKVTANGRSLNLLQVDTSGGAYDISYDAWNWLSTGQNATALPTMGGGIPAEYESVPMDECKDLMKDDKLPLMAAHSINYYVGCPAGSWVHENSQLWNIQNSVCTLGYNELCTLDLAISNQPSCPHMLGDQSTLAGQPVYNVAYGTGKESLALQ